MDASLARGRMTQRSHGNDGKVQAMTINLESLLKAAQAPGANGAQLSKDERRTAIKELLAEADSDTVTAVLNEAIDGFKNHNETAGNSTEDLLGLELLIDAMETTREVQTEHKAAEQALEQQRADLAARAAKITGELDTDAAPGDPAKPAEGADAENAGDPAIVKGDTDDDKDKPAGGTDAGAEGGADADAAAGAELVTASADKSYFSVGNIKKRAAPVRTEQTAAPEAKSGGLKILTASGVRGHETSQELNGITELAAAASARIKGLPTKGVRATAKADIATFVIEFPDELVASAGKDDAPALRAAVDVKRLPEEELTAAGWCSPSEVLYDIPGSLTDANAGLLNLPEVQMARGGLRFRRQIDFGEIYSGGMAARVMTEAMAESEDPVDYTKEFYRLTCPEFTEVRADAVYTGATAGILQNHAYPEEVEAQISELVAAHAHKVNQISISRIETMFALQNAVNFATFGPSASTSQLNAIDWLITNERYRYRANESMRFKVALPIWDKAVFRADYALKHGIPDAYDVTDEQIDAWFSKRGASVDWVYDWQDALTGGTVGATVTPVLYPTSVKALVYPEGTIVRGRGDIINLEAVYDSVGLSTNEFLRLFMEESLAIAWRAYRGSVATIPLAVNGATGAARELVHGGGIAPAAA